MLHHKNHHNQSFTLIELLVVIGVIGVIGVIAILASVIVVGTGPARTQAQDNQRKADLAAYQSALQLYYSDHKSYPLNTQDCNVPGNCLVHQVLADLETQNYLSPLPTDPLNSGDYQYKYSNNSSTNGKTYKLYVKLERDTEAMKSDGGLDDAAYEVFSTMGNQLAISFPVSGSGGGLPPEPEPEPEPEPPAWSCGQSITDTRDGGQTYATVQIGTQCWLKQNLNVGTMLCADQQGATSCATNQTNNGIIEKYCYNNDLNNCTTYGGLYQWNEAMQYTTVEGAQGICPTGWHIPTDAEWHTLEDGLKDEGTTCDPNREEGWDCATAGAKIKVGGTSGFEGKLGGFRNSSGGFAALRSRVVFWSSTQYWDSCSRVRELSSDATAVYRIGGHHSIGFSVRCLKD